MNVYTYSEARQNFASVLDTAKKKGKVLIKRKDGTTFAIVPEKGKRSPLDVPGVTACTLHVMQWNIFRSSLYRAVMTWLCHLQSRV